MKFYLVELKKYGAYIKYPDVGHKKYKIAGYSPDMKQSIWIVEEENVPMNSPEVTEITEQDAVDILDLWFKPLEEQE